MWKSLKRLFGGGGEDPPSPPGPPEEDPPAPGWDAIDAAFSALYGAKEAAHWGHGGVMAMNDLRTPPQLSFFFTSDPRDTTLPA